MKCLVFAHYPEAQCFLDYFKFQKLSAHPQFFFSEDLETYLLITGEGTFSTLTNLSHVLGTYPQIKTIINYGVAGSLDTSIPIGSLHSIRTGYAYLNSEFLYHSQTSKDNSAFLDCISASKREHSATDCTKMLAYAPIVDRELWSISYCAKEFKKDWFSYKVISDHIISSEKACLSVMAMAQDYSLQFLNHFMLHKTAPSPLTKELLDLPKGFYFTHSQKIDFFKLIQALHLKEGNIPQINYDEYLAKEITPKKKTEILLLNLRERLSPEISHLNKKITHCIQPLTQKTIKLTYPKDLSDSHCKIEFEVKNKDDWQKKINALSEFEIEKYFDLFEGK